MIDGTGEIQVGVSSRRVRIDADEIFVNGAAVEKRLVVWKGLKRLLADEQRLFGIIAAQADGLVKAMLKIIATVAAKHLIDAHIQQLRQRDEQIDIGRGLSRFPAGDGLRCDVERGGKSVLCQAFFCSVLADDLADRLFGKFFGKLLLFEIRGAVAVFSHVHSAHTGAFGGFLGGGECR